MSLGSTEEMRAMSVIVMMAPYPILNRNYQSMRNDGGEEGLVPSGDHVGPVDELRSMLAVPELSTPLVSCHSLRLWSDEED